MTTTKNWKRTFGQKLRHMTIAQAREFISSTKGQVNIGDQRIRDLTGGYSSQAIDFHVKRQIGLKAAGLK
jgi:hypothetical protein